MILAVMLTYQTPAPRLGIVLHYVIARTAGYEFGAIKLNKAVYAADAEYFRRYGKSITGATSFQKQRLGPVPNGVLRELGKLQASGKISRMDVQTPAGVRKEFVAKVQPDPAALSVNEINTIDSAIDSLMRVTAFRASERTHDALWDEVPQFGQIPVKAAAFKPVEVDDETLAWALNDER